MCFFLPKICGYLTSKSWETRVAAGQAVEAIAKNVRKWSPPEPENEGEPVSPTENKTEDLMSFFTFNIQQVSVKCL